MSAMFSAKSRATIGKAMVVSQAVLQIARRVLCLPRGEGAGNSRQEAKPSTNARPRLAWLALGALAGAVCIAPVAQATPVTYNFTVEFSPYPEVSGPLAGAATETGSFTFDSSSITPDAVNVAPGLLTALDFVHNGILYDETTANTGHLIFDQVGDLTGFDFGTDCRTGSCSANNHSNDWAAMPGLYNFRYGTPDTEYAWVGILTYALVPYSSPDPTGVPEPGALGTMTLGLALLAILYRRRRLS